MTRDPAEGVDADGFVVTGAAAANIPAVYRPVLDDCVATLTAAFGDRLDGLYLYGSVATGQARPPHSDLDLLALWTSTVDDAADVVAALSTRHGAVVREVGLAQGTVRALAEEADRCFLKEYCLPLAGRDRRPDLARCRPSRALADGFNGDLAGWVQRLRSTVDGRDPVRVARRLLLAVATIESVSHASWSTDRATGAALLAEHHPQWTSTAVNALALIEGAGDPSRVDDLVELADWLTRHP